MVLNVGPVLKGKDAGIAGVGAISFLELTDLHTKKKTTVCW